MYLIKQMSDVQYAECKHNNTSIVSLVLQFLKYIEHLAKSR